ncbi:MAG: alpha/beta hydrolase [Xenophilus sp.]
MTETPVLFGPDGGRLLGVVTRPAGPSTPPLACLLLNQGAGDRTGPRRINVKLARRLAEHGIASIRMDLAGLGDSGAPSGQGDFVQQGVADLQAAMDLLQSTLGVRRFAPIGLCSGGVHGLAVAGEDPRVAGLMMFDSFSFARRRVVLMRRLRKIAALPFNAPLRGRVAEAVRQRLGPPRPQIYQTLAPDEHERRFRAAMQKLAARGTAVCMLSSGSLDTADSGRDQLGRMGREPFARDIEYRFEPRIDHTLVTLESQRLFLDLACGWARRVAHQAATASAQAQPAQRDAPALAASTGFGALMA